MVSKTDGWGTIQPCTRKSSYYSADYKKVAPFSDFVLNAINTSNPDGQTKEKRPYVGAQFVDIPAFQSIGEQIGQQIAATLTGSTSVDQALASAQSATQRAIRQAGYR